MKRMCMKTCGFCNAPTTALPPPPPPKPTWTVNPAGRCGVPKRGTRVIGGTNAIKGAWPWQVLIEFIGRPHCGGALVSPWWVVTAAHCVHENEFLKHEYQVVTGEQDFKVNEGTETYISVSKIIAHPAYSALTLDNDIALLKLQRPAPFGKYVGTVCMPDEEDDVPVGTNCMITGWGKISAKGSMHHVLQQAPMPIVSADKCSALNKNTGIQITDRMLCAGYGPGNKISGCHGDSGGPLVCMNKQTHQWFLQGAVSWGSGSCDSKEAYTVFARVSHLRRWIDQNIKDN